MCLGIMCLGTKRLEIKRFTLFGLNVLFALCTLFDQHALFGLYTLSKQLFLLFL